LVRRRREGKGRLGECSGGGCVGGRLRLGACEGKSDDEKGGDDEAHGMKFLRGGPRFRTAASPF
jgi:hypothetical protein